MRRLPLALSILPFLVQAQKFEVAAIKPSQPGQGNSTSINTNTAGFRTRNISLVGLIQFAYSVHSYQLSGGAGWMKDDRYDIVATYDVAEDGNFTAQDTSKLLSRDARIRARLRDLLAERFQLKIREEEKELPVYHLVVDKSGLKMKATTDGKGNMNTNQNNGTGTLRADGTTMKRLCDAFSGILGRPVVDQTGLSQLYMVELKWSDGAGDSGGPSMFTAVKEQLGLRLESAKGPVTTYVIERAEKPSEN